VIAIKFDVDNLPSVLGHFAPIRAVILATGRTAVARVGGVTAVRRHVATANRLGLEPVVLFPARMKALGAEIAGEIDGRARCVSSDALADEAGKDEELALVIAGDWYVSPTAIIAFSHRTRGPAVARFVDRGRVVAPLARMPVQAIRALIPELGEHPAAELIDRAATVDTISVPLEVSERHRLSDNVAVRRCEAKLFGWIGNAAEGSAVSAVQRFLAIPMTRWLAATRTTPMHVAVVKIAAGIASAWVLAHKPYVAGLIGAALYFLSRVLDMVAGDLARAAVLEGSRGEKLDVAGDVIVLLLLVGALVLRSSSQNAAALGLVATAGILISTVTAYARVFRWNWQAEVKAGAYDPERRTAASDRFVSRFWRDNGLAYALLFGALIGRLDLVLWAAAAGAHAFYVLWLLSDMRRQN